MALCPFPLHDKIASYFFISKECSWYMGNYLCQIEPAALSLRFLFSMLGKYFFGLITISISRFCLYFHALINNSPEFPLAGAALVLWQTFWWKEMDANKPLACFLFGKCSWITKVAWSSVNQHQNNSSMTTLSGV